MIKKYVKKPIIIEAIQWVGNNLSEITKFCTSGVKYSSKVDGLIITTLEGHIIASLGDFVIKGVQGEFYPCKPGIFEKTYEEML